MKIGKRTSQALDKFSEVFSLAMPGEVWHCDGDEVLKVSEVNPCVVCGEDCQWVSVSFHAFYCSGRCLQEQWEGYFKQVSQG